MNTDEKWPAKMVQANRPSHLGFRRFDRGTYNGSVSMNKIFATSILAITSLTAIQPADAQGYNQGRPSITLFTGLDYKGQSVTITSDTPNLRDLNFDEVSSSLVARGEWEVCLDPNYGSRCRTYNSSITDLRSFRGRISSIRYVGRDGQANSRPDYNGGYGNPPRYSGQSTPGRSTVYFPGSINLGGALTRMDGNQFCRSQGLNGAVYAGQDRNGYLEDVLCRR